MIMEHGIILAEAASNSDIITWGIVITLTTVGANVAAVVLAFSNRKQKREVSFGFIPASKDEFDKHVENNKSEHEQLFSKIGGVERGGTANTDKKVDSLRHEITAIGKEVSALQASTEFQNQTLAAVTADIKTLLSRHSNPPR